MCNSPFKASDFFIGEKFDGGFRRCQQVDFVAVGSIVVGDAVGAVGEYLDVHVCVPLCGWFCFSGYRLSRLWQAVNNYLQYLMNEFIILCLTSRQICEIMVIVWACLPGIAQITY
ncbi:p57 [Xanthomonas phage Xop411]|uniref:p57 n=1 Tax=Xanthomonas phage Xop411 TaxID=2913975 RepID=A5H1J7_9CAUD|nr:p57 [Xanthomonas phage Xop411]ABK00201.2 p57 [Xanthomonas phage Xop411]